MYKRKDFINSGREMMNEKIIPSESHLSDLRLKLVNRSQHTEIT
jgi:hypothetical protein